MPTAPEVDPLTDEHFKTASATLEGSPLPQVAVSPVHTPHATTSDNATRAVPEFGANRSDWDRVAHKLGPKFGGWMLASAITGGIMLCVVPLRTSSPVLVSIAVLILTPSVFLLGWMSGMSVFAISCATWRGIGWHTQLFKILPILLCAVAALGVLGGGYWWVLSVVMAILGHRKGRQRAWWGAVCCVAFVFRSPFIGQAVARSNEEALSKAIDSVNREIRNWARA